MEKKRLSVEVTHPFTSINLVRIALETMEEVEKQYLSEEDKWTRFYKKLEYLLEQVGEQLKIRYDFQKTGSSKTVSNCHEIFMARWIPIKIRKSY